MNNIRLLFSYRDIRWLLAGTALWQLSFSLVLLPLLVVVHDVYNSWAVAGTALALGSLGNAVAGPVQGQLMDRYGVRRVMIVCGLMSSLFFVVAAVASVPLLVAAAAAVGVTLRPNPAMLLRLMWKKVIPDVGDQQIGHAFVGVQSPAMHALGPLMASALMTAASASWAVIVGGVIAATSYIVYTQASTARTHPTTSSSQQALSTERLFSWGVVAFLGSYAALYVVNSVVGMITIARADEAGMVNIAGVLVAVSSLTGAVVAAVLAARAQRLQAHQIYVATCLTMVVIVIGLALAPSLAVFGGILLVFGGSWAAVNVAISILLSAVPLSSRQAELLGWAASMTALGDAVGRAVAGVLIDAHMMTAGLIGCAVVSLLVASVYPQTRAWILERDRAAQENNE